MSSIILTEISPVHCDSKRPATSNVETCKKRAQAYLIGPVANFENNLFGQEYGGAGSTTY